MVQRIAYSTSVSKETDHLDIYRKTTSALSPATIGEKSKEEKCIAAAAAAVLVNIGRSPSDRGSHNFPGYNREREPTRQFSPKLRRRPGAAPLCART